MFIKKIEIQNFQAIKEFNGDFEGNVYLVTGENELGKSTLLKAIMVLLTGNRDEVLRNGEDKGFARIVVGGDGKEYEVELRMTKANPRGTITIKSKDKGIRSDRITALQEIFGYQDFDANEFASWSETAEGRRKQVQIVKSLLPESVQKRLSEIEARTAKIKEQRKEDNATLKTYSAVFSKMETAIKPEDVKEYAEEWDIQELITQQTEAMRLNEKANAVRERLAQREKTIAEIPERLKTIDTLKAQVSQARAEAEADAKRGMEEMIKQAKDIYNTKMEDIKSKFEIRMFELEDEDAKIRKEEEDAIHRRDNCKAWLSEYESNKPEDLTAKIADVQRHNEMYRKVQDYLSAKENKEEAEAKVDNHEKELLSLSEERDKLIKDSDLPIAGLNFTEDGLELNGIPFAAGKVSDSQIMEVAARIIIAKNPTVKVFRIARGESLGKKKLEALVRFAKENGFQGFIENVVREQNELRVEEYTER